MPFRAFPLAFALLAGACTQPNTGTDEPPPPPDGRSAFVVTSDYSDSVMARVDLDSGKVHDGLAAFPAGDMILDVEGEDIYLISRSGEDVIRRYPKGDFSRAPDLEVSTGAASNPQALTLCAGRLWVSLYNRSELIALDPSSGDLLQTVSLHAFDEGEDGSCEPSSMVEFDGSLYLALERFDLHDLRADPEGRIIEVDCGDGAIVQEWTTGPSPQIQVDPSAVGDLLVKEGSFYAVDGGVRSLELTNGEFSDLLLAEEGINADLSGLAASGDHLVASGWAFGTAAGLSSIHCLDRSSGEQRIGPADLSQNIWHLSAAPNGEVWATITPSATAAGAEHGIMRIDPSSCSATATELTPFLLPPTHIAFMELG